jgi:hypothetical protein
MSRSNCKPEGKQEQPMGTKRKAVATVAPGYLGDLLQARQRIKSMGLKAAHATSSSGSSSGAGSSGVARPSLAYRPGSKPAAALRQEQPYMAPTTLPLLFAQRKKFLQSKREGTPQPYRLNEEMPVGLLSLPEDVLVRQAMEGCAYSSQKVT